jgi:hypothetical protein
VVDSITVLRIQKLLLAARFLMPDQITMHWLARALVRVDSGPMLDGPRLGPALRNLNFRRVRRRQGARRLNIWVKPGAPVPRPGRPRVAR